MVGSKISQSRPHTIMIRKLSELLVSGNHRPASGFISSDSSTSPRSPLEYPRIQSPTRGLKNFDLGGVGLGIVAALEKSSTAEVLAKHSVCCTPKPSDPIQVDEELLENYTYVTSRGGSGGKPCTKVYYDGGEIAAPAAGNLLVEEIGYPTSSFLNCCHSCKKQLQGLDIYMYRGETAFCSSECRSMQIVMDEQQERKQKQKRKHKCRGSVSVDTTTVSAGPSPPMFSTGILAI